MSNLLSPLQGCLEISFGIRTLNSNSSGMRLATFYRAFGVLDSSIAPSALVGFVVSPLRGSLELWLVIQALRAWLPSIAPLALVGFVLSPLRGSLEFWLVIQALRRFAPAPGYLPSHLWHWLNLFYRPFGARLKLRLVIQALRAWLPSIAPLALVGFVLSLLRGSLELWLVIQALRPDFIGTAPSIAPLALAGFVLSPLRGSF